MPRGICGACWNATDEKAGTLTDSSGKKWEICGECINSLWHLHDSEKENTINASLDDVLKDENLKPDEIARILRQLADKFGGPDE